MSTSAAVESDAASLQADGNAAFAAGASEEAQRLYSSALELRPDDATLLSNRSAALLALGREEAALKDACRAVELRPRWGKAHARHGAALAALCCTKDAISAYERAVKFSSSDASVMMQTELSGLKMRLAEEEAGGASSTTATSEVADTDALQSQGTEAFKVADYAQAQAKWSAALLRRPDDPTLLSNRSAAWLALGETQLALDDAMRCVQVQPGWYKGYGRLGAAYDSLGRLDDALSAYKRGLEVQPESAVLKGEYERLQASQKEHEKAQKSAASSSQSDGGDGSSDSGGLSLTGLALAKECNKLGRPQQAVRELDKLLAKKFTDGELYCERSLAHANCHRLALAHEDASTAVYLYGQQHDPDIKPWEDPKELGVRLMTRQEKNELAKKEGRAYLLRGQAEVRLCDYDAAMRTFQLGCKADARLGPEALKELREAWYAAKELCRGWRRAGRLKKVEKKRVAFAAERKPVLHDITQFELPEDKAAALKNLAGIHAKWEMHEEAVELLTMALTHQPADQLLVFERAKEHIALGNYPLALPDVQQVVAKRPGWIDGLILLGNVESQLGLWSDAAKHWHEALQLQPHNPHLKRNLERASVEMSPEEKAKYEGAVSGWQTGDRGGATSHDTGGVELEEYEENGRIYYRPKGLGEQQQAKEEQGASSSPPTPSSAPSHPDFLERAISDLKDSDASARPARVVGETSALKRAATPAPADKWGSSASVASSAVTPGLALLGRSVIIDGLIARPALNGSRGVATSFNPETGRYNVQLPKGEMIALKTDNLTAATDAAAAAAEPSPTGAASSALSAAAADHTAADKEGGDAASDAPSSSASKKTSIGARLAAKRNAKGIAWAKGGIDGKKPSALSGMFATDDKRQEVAARRAAQPPIDEDYDEVDEAEAERIARLSPAERELERKASELKELATKHMSTLNTHYAIGYLNEAIKLRPDKKELWSNRSHAYELQHVHDKALIDGEKVIELAPDWPKGYLRTARALMSLERGAEAAARLRTALELAPRDSILLSAYKEAMTLAECTRRTERAIKASALPTFNGVGDSDIVEIARGACFVKGCDCNAYIQKHGRTTVHLLGRGHVRQDNDETFFLCARCGHDCTKHRDLREVAQKRSKPGQKLPAAPRSVPNARMAVDTIESVGQNSYTNAGRGTRGGLEGSSYYYAAVKDQNAAADTQSGATEADKDEWDDGADEAEDPSFLSAGADPFAEAADPIQASPSGELELSDPFAAASCEPCASISECDDGFPEVRDPLALS